MQDKQFVHLHVHTQYSMLDGAAKIDRLFPLCEKLNMPAIAITDHGNMYGVYEFIKQAVKYTDPNADFFKFMSERRPFKIKPIIGCEMYMDKDISVKETISGKMPKFNHLVLLAKDKQGYQNLIKLVSFSYIDGLYYKPRIDMPLLKKYSKGLIALSACLAGALPQAILGGDLDEADKIVKEFKSIFGEDYYIELQDHNIKDQKMVLPHLIKIAKANNVKTVITNDIHYLEKSDAQMQKVLQCISFRKTLSDAEIDDFDGSGESLEDDNGYFPTKEFYLKSRSELEQVFPHLGEALDNSLEIAQKCEPYFFSKEQLLPQYKPADGSTPIDFLTRLTFDGLNKKYGNVSDEIRHRAEYELGIIEKMGFVEYFLIVWDFINHAESQGIPVGPGRGSGVGSIVAYAIGITKVEPLGYDLIFERFLNPERVSSPDFDIDFCVDRREEVIKYVVEKYGANNVSQIVTFGTLAAKAAVKDVGRVYNRPYAEVEKITKLIPSMMGKAHLGDLVGLGEKKHIIPELKEAYELDATTKNIIDMAIKIEGMPRQTGMHAAGVIICRDAIYDHIPMAKTSDGYTTTQFNMTECEELGLLKMDFLGLRTLTDIKKALDFVKETHGKEIDFYSLGYDDAGVFQLLGEGDTHAVFQLESEGMKRFMRDLKPTVFEDIIAGISLYRPGPMDKIGDYVAGKRNPDKIQYMHPLLEPILNVSYGVMVYQEQVMKIVQVLAGYSLGRADELRRIMSKKKAALMEAERKVFLYGGVHNGKEILGAIKNGVPEKIANKIFDDMASFASYAFNKSHAAAYAVLGYQTAYLKKYYTVEFIAAVLNNRITSIDEIRNYLSYLKAKNIAVLPPDINKSVSTFSVENGAIRIGMSAIKNVGTSVIEAIVSERKRGGEFLDFEQFVSRMDNATLNKKMLESLILSGTFDCFGCPRAQLMEVYEGVLARASKDREAKKSGQFSFFDNASLFGDMPKIVYPNVKEYPLSQKLKLEREVAGVYLTGHPLEEYSDFLNTFKFNSSLFAAAIENDSVTDGDIDDSEDDGKNSTALEDNMNVTLGGMLVEADKRFTKNGKELGIGKLEDLFGTVEILASGYVLTKCKDVWKTDSLVTVSGKVRLRDGEVSVWVDKIEAWNNGVEKTQKVKKICVYYPEKTDQFVSELQDICLAYPGSDMAYMKILSENKLYPLDLCVNICDAFLSELYGLVGNNIKIID